MGKKLTWKIWLLIIILILSWISIFGFFPRFFQEGVLVTSVDANSTAFEQGLRQGQIITSIDGNKIENSNDYFSYVQEKFTGEKIKIVIQTENSEIILFSNSAPEITVSDIPKTNLKLGLDLSGGSRALVQAADKKLSSSEVSDLVDITNNRFNEFGISDISVRPVSDLSGNHFMLVEIAGATPTDLEELLAKQGKFEAKIGNDTVFVGGNKDIASVCRNDASCARIESCDQVESGYACKFIFAVYLSEEAAEKHAGITSGLEANVTSGGKKFLSKKLDFYLDDRFLEEQSLLISEGLKGRVTTQISIEGSGTGATREDAYNNAQESMKKLQTILITGSLPYKLEIVKLDTISPVLGSDFIKSIFIAGFIVLLSVSLIIFVRYKKFKSSISVVFTCLSEVLITLGIASFINWNIDLPSIAGIIAAIGTGVDDQIVILDEARFKTTLLTLKQKLKRAFSIVLGAYFTVLVSLLPLLWAGAGLLKGFAITTIIGITAGVLITRPAFMDIVRMIEE